jgi:ATP-dependent DNA helicase RecG
LLRVMKGEQSREEIQAKLNLANREHFRKGYLVPALEAGLIERTIPDKPNSRLQKYRLTATGHAQIS